MNKLFKRNCPGCGKIMEYKAEYLLKRSLNGTGLCRNCYLNSWNRFSGKKHSDDYRKLRSELMKGDINPTKGKKHNSDTIKKIKEKRASQVITDETKKKIGKAHTGKIVSDETKKKIGKAHTGKIVSDETKKKLSNSRKVYFANMSDSEYMKYCKLMRLSSIKYWKNNHPVFPNYNINSIPILEQKAKELGITDLQHAENGGEFFISELGYWVDGYSKEKNIVIEYYEPFHSKQTEKDFKRQKEIEEFLKCEFIIINEKTK